MGSALRLDVSAATAVSWCNMRAKNLYKHVFERKEYERYIKSEYQSYP